MFADRASAKAICGWLRNEPEPSDMCPAGAARTSALKCVDTVSRHLRQAVAEAWQLGIDHDRRRTMTTRPSNRRQPETQASLRIPTCDRLTSRRPTASNKKKRVLNRSDQRYQRENAGSSTVSASHSEKSSLREVHEKDSDACLAMTIIVRL